MFLGSKRFREFVRWLLIGRNVIETNLSILDRMSNKMIAWVRVVIGSSRVEFQGWLATIESSLSLIKLNRSCFVFRDLEFELDSTVSVFAKTQNRFD